MRFMRSVSPSGPSNRQSALRAGNGREMEVKEERLKASGHGGRVEREEVCLDCGARRQQLKPNR